MSNLGGYQTLTEVAKKVGGPTNLIVITSMGGALVYKGSEIAVKKCVKLVRNSKNERFERQQETKVMLEKITTDVIQNVMRKL